MQPPTKDQADLGQDNVILDASHSDDNKDTARQEFKNEADINYMLNRFGITPERGAPTYGEWDDSIDLQSALQAVAEARTGYATLPEELRNKFKSMEALLTALQEGSLVIQDGDIPAPKPTTEELLQKRITTLEERLTRPPEGDPPA